MSEGENIVPSLQLRNGINNGITLFAAHSQRSVSYIIQRRHLLCFGGSAVTSQMAFTATLVASSTSSAAFCARWAVSGDVASLVAVVALLRRDCRQSARNHLE